jgi:hypothetical protein
MELQEYSTKNGDSEKRFVELDEKEMFVNEGMIDGILRNENLCSFFLGLVNWRSVREKWNKKPDHGEKVVPTQYTSQNRYATNAFYATSFIHLFSELRRSNTIKLLRSCRKSFHSQAKCR